MPMDSLTEKVLARLARVKCLVALIEKELKQPQASLGYEECSYVSELEALCEEMCEAAEERMREILRDRYVPPSEVRYCEHCTDAPALVEQDGGSLVCPSCGVVVAEGEHGCQDDFADGIPEVDELAEAARQVAADADGLVTVTFAGSR